MEKLRQKNYQIPATLLFGASILVGVSHENPVAADNNSSAESFSPMLQPNVNPKIIDQQIEKRAAIADQQISRGSSRRSVEQPKNNHWLGDVVSYNNLTTQAKQNVEVINSVAKNADLSISEVACLDNIGYQESRLETQVQNSSSGAYGIPQSLPGSKMESAGNDWRTNPATQIEWMISYVNDRYGGPCQAWDYWQANGSY